MSSPSRPDLTALLGSRICHDLISPLGAIGNGLELLRMTGTGDGPEAALMADSVQSANARIRFFRIAFGAAAGDQRIGRTDLAGVLDDYYREGRIALTHRFDPDLARADAKLALLVLLCLESALPRGGDIALSGGAGRWQLRADAERLKVEDRLWSALTQPQPPGDVTPAEVQFALLPHAAAEAGRALSVTLGTDAIEVWF
ncbi:histidine phosphotransferase family protein [Actibacterium sp. D379-3]